MSAQSTIGSSVEEPTPLSRHFFQCEHASGPLHALACSFEGLHAFCAQRRVTTLTVALILAVVAGLLS
ncbi:MAG: hypothetical protein ACTS8S_14615 [Giesbergeria sp.]